MTEENKPKEAPLTIAQQKKLCCQKLQDVFNKDLMHQRLLRMCGNDESKLAKYMTAYLGLITKDQGSGPADDKKYYMQCSISSLTTCFLESLNMQLPFDSRQLVSLIIYDYEVKLDISYKGFVNALNRVYSDAFVECKLVFEDDYFTSEITDRIASYVYRPQNPFREIKNTFEGIAGGYCFFSYTDTDGETTSRLVFLSKAQILKNKQRAKTKYVWDSDPKAMGEKTCIREGAKIPFAAIEMDVDVEETANQHYKLEDHTASNRIGMLREAQKNVVDDMNEEEESPINPPAPSKPEKKEEAPAAPPVKKPVAPEVKENPKAPVGVDTAEEALKSPEVATKDQHTDISTKEPSPAVPEDISDADFEEMEEVGK